MCRPGPTSSPRRRSSSASGPSSCSCSPSGSAAPCPRRRCCCSWRSGAPSAGCSSSCSPGRTSTASPACHGSGAASRSSTLQGAPGRFAKSGRRPKVSRVAAHPPPRPPRRLRRPSSAPRMSRRIRPARETRQQPHLALCGRRLPFEQRAVLNVRADAWSGRLLPRFPAALREVAEGLCASCRGVGGAISASDLERVWRRACSTCAQRALCPTTLQGSMRPRGRC
mmetsp:Transcript_25641/g.71999  ORF Transcript_25641/g.71999 Transcript_25641/m.71999 type:complete len:225 (+) Transcript_25641:445-1119(+)